MLPVSLDICKAKRMPLFLVFWLCRDLSALTATCFRIAACKIRFLRIIFVFWEHSGHPAEFRDSRNFGGIWGSGYWYIDLMLIASAAETGQSIYQYPTPVPSTASADAGSHSIQPANIYRNKVEPIISFKDFVLLWNCLHPIFWTKFYVQTSRHFCHYHLLPSLRFQ